MTLRECEHACEEQFSSNEQAGAQALAAESTTTSARSKMSDWVTEAPEGVFQHPEAHPLEEDEGDWLQEATFRGLPAAFDAGVVGGGELEAAEVSAGVPGNAKVSGGLAGIDASFSGKSGVQGGMPAVPVAVVLSRTKFSVPAKAGVSVGQRAAEVLQTAKVCLKEMRATLSTEGMPYAVLGTVYDDVTYSSTVFEVAVLRSSSSSEELVVDVTRRSGDAFLFGDAYRRLAGKVLDMLGLPEESTPFGVMRGEECEGLNRGLSVPQLPASFVAKYGDCTGVKANAYRAPSDAPARPALAPSTSESEDPPSGSVDGQVSEMLSAAQGESDEDYEQVLCGARQLCEAVMEDTKQAMSVPAEGTVTAALIGSGEHLRKLASVVESVVASPTTELLMPVCVSASVVLSMMPASQSDEDVAAGRQAVRGALSALAECPLAKSGVMPQHVQDAMREVLSSA